MTPSISMSTLRVSWDDYYALIAAQEGRPVANAFCMHVFEHQDGSYLQEAEDCLALFRGHGSFASLPNRDRKTIAGFGPHTTGHFGCMRGAGKFMSIVNTQPTLIGSSLDGIPLTGAVSSKQARTFLQSVMGLGGVGLACASRLLGMKRADLFLPVNRGNYGGIAHVFGWQPWNVDDYLSLHDRIWGLPWFASPAPRDVNQKRVWHTRVAMLDAVLYDG